MVDDDDRCEVITDGAGEVIAVARVSGALDERGREALTNVIAAARRLAEEEAETDPGRPERQRAAVERIRARAGVTSGRTCPRCGSPRWVSGSLDGGWTRRAQCVPCGAWHPGVIGPGWRSPDYRDPDAVHPAYREADR